MGWYYRQANYSEYKLMKTGLEFQPTIRIPYVHIMFRVDIGFAQMFSGNPWGLTNMSNGGVDTTFGVGLRIPIVRWMSFAVNFDWSYIGLAVSGDDASGARQDSVGQRSTTGGYLRAHLPLHRRAEELALARFVHVVDEGARLSGRGLRHDAVAQVEDVAGTASRAVEHL